MDTCCETCLLRNQAVNSVSVLESLLHLDMCGYVIQKYQCRAALEYAELWKRWPQDCLQPGNHITNHNIHDGIRSRPWAPWAILPTRESWRLLKPADLLIVLSLTCKLQSSNRKDTSQATPEENTEQFIDSHMFQVSFPLPGFGCYMKFLKGLPSPGSKTGRSKSRG